MKAIKIKSPNLSSARFYRVPKRFTNLSLEKTLHNLFAKERQEGSTPAIHIGNLTRHFLITPVCYWNERLKKDPNPQILQALSSGAQRAQSALETLSLIRQKYRIPLGPLSDKCVKIQGKIIPYQSFIADFLKCKIK